MKIGILQTGYLADEMVDKHGNIDDVFKLYLADRGFEFETFRVVENQFPKSSLDADGWIITGSKFGAYEDHPWIKPLEEFICATYQQGVPIFGVCFGHQIIAQALGGKVEKFEGGWSCGPQVYQSELFGTQELVAWHQDQVVKLPEDAELIGSSDFCENAILAYDDKILTIQPHPEFSPDLMSDLLAARGKDLPENIQSHVKTAPTDTLTRVKFAEIVEEFFKRDRG